MILIPNDAQKIDVDGSTVDFFQFNLNDCTYYAFDTSRCGPPEPMVNAMAGLRLLDAPNKKLLMINHKNPSGLFDKIGADFKVETSIRDNGFVEVIFSFKALVDMDEPQYCSSCH